MSMLPKRNLTRPGWAGLGLLVVALLGLLAAQACTSSAQSIGSGQQEASGGAGLNGGEFSPAIKVGRPAPDFTLADLDGNQVSLSDFRGKAVFINFWASWCPPCRAEMPEIEAVHQEYKDKGVVVIGVDIAESEDTVRQYVQRGGYSWTFVMDTTGEVAGDYGIMSIPTNFFLDREGIIRAVKSAAMTRRAMAARLDEAMK